MKKLVALLVLTLTFAGCTQVSPGDPTDPDQPIAQVDDWQLDLTDNDAETMSGTVMSSSGSVAQMTGAPAPAMEAARLGFSVGGAKDIGNFRENIENDYLPIPSDLTYEGLFYNYFFDTGEQEPCDQLFCPSYSTAISRDPFSNNPEYYLSVGLNSGIKEEDFQRKKLNLVIVLDISGSMGSPFDQYYYDRFGNYIESEEGEESNKTKMEIASQSVVALMDHLAPEDHFGMVVFDDQSYLAKPLGKVAETDMKAIKDHVLELSDRGGTNMEAGYNEGTDLFKELREKDPNEYENRIIFITDAQPNIGETTREGLPQMIEDNSDDGINTTFIGVGVDFNTQLIELMTKTRGANYYSVHSEDEFKERMDENFDFMVTPLVYDLKLQLEAEGWEIAKVFGSPEANEATGEIMKVNTLFPSKTEDGEVRGGIVLLKLRKTGEGDGELTLSASYENRSGQTESDESQIQFPDFNEGDTDHYANTGIHKAIALTRYAATLNSWAIDEHRSNPVANPPLPVDCGPIILMESTSTRPNIGIIYPEPPFIPPCIEPHLGEWERQSKELTVSSHYKQVFNELEEYLLDQIDIIADPEMQQEIDLLQLLQEA